MATTHALLGAALGLPLLALAPEWAGHVATWAFLGGLFPDLDALVGAHRRTLHHAELYPVVAAAAVTAAVVAPGPLTVGLAAALAGAALHALSEVLGGGLALRPWERDDDRGLYLHSRGRWVPPRRWVRYDGAPEDLFLAATLAAALALAVDGSVRWLALGALALSVPYVLLRKRLVERYPAAFAVE